MTYYKVLNADGSAIYGTGKWHLPKGKRPGKWMPRIDRLEPCESGYHACRPQDLVLWLGPTIYEVEFKGEMVECDDKVVGHQARLVRRCEHWNEMNARLFACACASRVLKQFEESNPGDTRPRKAIAVARKYARGQATPGQLAAAGDAAWDAAGDAAGDAAWDAAGDAAWAAAGTAARTAAWAAELQWQTRTLLRLLTTGKIVGQPRKGK